MSSFPRLLVALSLGILAVSSGCSTSSPAVSDGGIDVVQTAADTGNSTPDVPSAAADVIRRPDFPSGTCGDGAPTLDEECEDGNNDDGDGCSADCKLERACPSTRVSAISLGARIHDDTRGAVSRANARCGGGTSPDLFYTFRLDVESTVTISTDFPGTTFDTAVYVRRVCADRASEINCVSDGDRGDTVRALLAAGEYYVVVDGVEGAAGEFDLQVDAMPRIPEGGNCTIGSPSSICTTGTVCLAGDGGSPRCIGGSQACASRVTVLPFGMGVSGTTIDAPNGYDPLCSEGGGGDKTYRLDLPSLGDVNVRLAPGSDFDAVLEATTECGNTDRSVACLDAEGEGDAETLDLREVSGSVFVTVDGFGTEGVFTLLAGFRPVAGAGQECDPSGLADRCITGYGCAAPSALASDAGVPAPDAGSLDASTPSADASSRRSVCVPASELLCMAGTPVLPTVSPIRGTLPTTASLAEARCSAAPQHTGEAQWRVSVDRSSVAQFLFDVGTTGFTYLRSTSCDVSRDEPCTALSVSGTTVLGYKNLEPGDHFLFADGVGAYTLTPRVLTRLASGAECDVSSTSARCGVGLACLRHGSEVATTCQTVEDLEDVPGNGTFCNAQGPLGGNALIAGVLDSAPRVNDYDVYQIELTRASALSVRTSNGAGGCDADTLVDIFRGVECATLDGGGTPTPLAVAGMGGGCVSLSPTTTPALASLAAGAYYVRVRPGGTRRGYYELLITSD